ncbi:peptide ABC transporter substrate-binding protein [Tengunoibacter tsumagoiensis]|uniref:ABC transporter substrate-binding protein n=1 Tax=Tengunoibacter tsumagoiensis TaxID=2014871 RepID=A0A402A215_9CHLR|nr:peptide ABC transporter substrate-binding protein [Tengunoibacter tsumagoiensis]GCE13095.1 ABC transporter substrate-binding protein [Tengunoibacter tsumagoiensis]
MYDRYRQKHLQNLLPLFCLLLILTGCDLFGGGTTVHKTQLKAPPSKQTYTIPEIGLENLDLETLDPALAHDPASIRAIQMVFTGLVQLDDQLQVRPQLAQSWSVSDDGLSWTFHLKPHLKFSDGTPLTSADVAYSIDRALQPATQSTIAPIALRLLKNADDLLAGRVTTLIGSSIQTPNDQTVVLITKEKAAYFPAMLTSSCSYIVEQSLIKTYTDKWTDHLGEGGGAGPFKVQQYTHHTSIIYVPNTNYYNAKPQLQKVTTIFYHSADEAYRDYQNNQLDLTTIPTSLTVDKRHKDYYQVPQLWENYYTMNYLAKPFDNIKIRQAFALAIDKQSIADTVWKGSVIPTNHIVPQGMVGYTANLTGPDGTTKLTGNVVKAKDLLQQGLKESNLTSSTDLPAITLSYVSGVDNFDQEVAALIQQWQKVLGVTVTPDPITDYNTLLDKITATTNNSNGLQMWGLGWVAEYPDPQDWLSWQFGQGAFNNNMNYGQNTSSHAAQQQIIQKQMQDADANTTESARLQSYQKAEQDIINDVGWIPISQVTSTFLRTTSIVGITNNGENLIPPDDWAHIYRVQA